MTDIFNPGRRSEVMSRIRAKNTAPELVVRSMVHRMGFRFRLHDRKLPGCPDLVLARLGRVIFVHGCFWHGHPGCKKSKLPESNREFWEAKISTNFARDRRNIAALRKVGWKVLVVWQCSLRNRARTKRRLQQFLERN